MPDYMTLKEVAKELQVSIPTVKNWIKSEKLKGYRFGRQYRISQADFQLFKDNSKQ